MSEAASVSSILALSDGASISMVQSSSLDLPTRDSIAANLMLDFNDENGYYKPIDFHDSIQDAYDEAAAFAGCIVKVATIPFVANKVYYDFRASVTDYLAVVGIWDQTAKKWLIPVSGRELDEIREDWETATGTPFLFWPVNYRYVAFFPRPTSAIGNFHIFYRATADTLAGDSTPDIPVEICEELIGSYVTMDLYEQQMEWKKANLAFKGYVTKTSELIKFLSKRDAERFRRLGGCL